MDAVAALLASLSPLEVASVAFALAYLVLAVQQNILCWLAALIGTLLSLALFVEARLYPESALQLFYAVMAVYGWRQWRRRGPDDAVARDLPVSTWPVKYHVAAIACTLAGPLYKFSRAQTVAMYVLTIPQAAATLAVTLIGFEIGLFGTSVVNAVLVLILVSIVVAALIAQRVVAALPAHVSLRPPLGGKVLVVTSSTGPSDAAVRAATLITRPDGGHSDVLITRTASEPRPDPTVLRALEKRIFSHGFDGHVRTEVGHLPDAVRHAQLAAEASLVIVDDAGFDASPGVVPLLVLDNGAPQIVADDDSNGVAAEIERRLARGEAKPLRLRRARST